MLLGKTETRDTEDQTKGSDSVNISGVFNPGYMSESSGKVENTHTNTAPRPNTCQGHPQRFWFNCSVTRSENWCFSLKALLVSLRCNHG